MKSFRHFLYDETVELTSERISEGVDSMELSLEADRLREIIDIVDAVVAEARFTVNEDELNVRAVDDSHVAMVDISVLSKGFEKYEVEGKETMALNLGKIQDFLKIVNSDAIVNLINESGKLKRYFEGE